MITRMPKKKKSLATNNCRHYQKTMKVGGCALDSLSLVFALHYYCFQVIPRVQYMEIYAYLVKQAIKVLN